MTRRGPSNTFVVRGISNPVFADIVKAAEDAQYIQGP
jgi:hypothetical protein